METYLSHHGILGMKWGVRRYQNKDGTLTDDGKKRYGNSEELTAKSKDATRKGLKSAATSAGIGVAAAKAAGDIKDFAREAMKTSKDYKYDSFTTDTAVYINSINKMNDYATIASGAYTVASILSGVGAVATIGAATVSAGKLAYAAYLKHQAKKAKESANA